MFIVSCFKFIFCYSYVCVFLVGVFLYDGGLVNNFFLKALAVEGQEIFSLQLQSLLLFSAALVSIVLL